MSGEVRPYTLKEALTVVSGSRLSEGVVDAIVHTWIGSATGGRQRYEYEMRCSLRRRHVPAEMPDDLVEQTIESDRAKLDKLIRPLTDADRVIRLLFTCCHGPASILQVISLLYTNGVESARAHLHTLACRDVDSLLAAEGVPVFEADIQSVAAM